MEPTARSIPRLLRICTFEEGVYISAKASINSLHQNAHLNAFTVTHPREKLLDEALIADKRSRDRTRKSFLDGRLIGIKDNICTSDLPTSCASEMLREYVSPFDATVVKQLKSAGAIIMGKTNMDEFGMGSHSTFSIHGAVRKPGPIYTKPLSAGGSSGGSAAAVAAGMCDMAIGTDTGGSVRLPASYCGIIGFKPSYGLISRWGVVAYANSLDTVGIFGRVLADAKNVFDILNQHDPNDPTSIPTNTRRDVGKRLVDCRRLARGSSARPLRIGVPAEYNVAELTPLVREAWERTLRYLTDREAEIVATSLPSTKAALPAYYILAPAEASSNLARYDGLRYGYRDPADRNESEDTLFAPTRDAGFGAEVQRRILLGAYTLSSEAIGNYFLQAQRVRRLIQRDFDKVFSMPNCLVGKGTWRRDGIDAIVVPTSLGVAPELEQVRWMSQVERYAGDLLTVPASMAGLPAVSVPVVEGVGMQVIAQWGDEKKMWKVAKMVEEMGRKGGVGVEWEDEEKGEEDEEEEEEEEGGVVF